MNELAQLDLPGLALTETSATLAGPMDRASVLGALDFLFGRESMTKWQAGDLAAALIADDGGDPSRTFRELCEPRGGRPARFAHAWVGAAIKVAQSCPPEVRRSGLSWGHHEVVVDAGFDPEAQDHWLGRAVTGMWSTRTLAQEILDAMVPRLPIDRPPRTASLPAPVLARYSEWAATQDPSSALMLRIDADGNVTAEVVRP